MMRSNRLHLAPLALGAGVLVLAAFVAGPCRPPSASNEPAAGRQPAHAMAPAGTPDVAPHVPVAATPAAAEDAVPAPAAPLVRHPLRNSALAAESVAGELLIKLGRAADPTARAALLARHGLAEMPCLPGLQRLGYVKVRLPAGGSADELAPRLTRSERLVVVAEPNYVVRMLATAPTPDEPPWYVTLSRFEQAWTQCRSGRRVRVAVVDTGVNRTLNGLRERCEPGYDFVNDRVGADDDNGHGTFVTGILATTGGAGGLCPAADILPLKALDASGIGSCERVAAAIILASDRGAQVINMSFGGYGASQLLMDAVAYAAERGCLLVAAGGNDGVDAEMYPAAWPGVIGVGALGRDAAIWPGSNRGRHIGLTAPGVDILSLSRDGRVVAASGTSSAAAIVSALAGLLRAERPDLSASGLRRALVLAAVDLGAPGRDPTYGAGRIDAAAALSVDVPPLHEVSIHAVTFESLRVGADEHVFAWVHVLNSGTYAEERGTLSVWANERLILEQPDLLVTDSLRLPVDLGPAAPLAACGTLTLKVVITPAFGDACNGDNQLAFTYDWRADDEGHVYVLLKQLPFVHSWASYQAYQILPPGPLKTELGSRQNLWGNAATNTLFGTDKIWEETCSVPSEWHGSTSYGNSLLEGAHDEDVDDYGITVLSGMDAALEHFWDPDHGYNHGIDTSAEWGRNNSALHRAHGWWKKAQEVYAQNGGTSEAYYWLGRVSHLLADMAVPEHVHLDPHPSDDIDFFWNDPADLGLDYDDTCNYEEYTKINYHSYTGSGTPVAIDALPLTVPVSLGAPSDWDGDFVRLFYNLAQMAQHADSSDVDGNNTDGDGATLSMGLACDAGSRNQSYPAIAYLNGRTGDRIDPGTTPTVQWQTYGIVGWTYCVPIFGWSTHQTLAEGPQPGTDYYVDVSRGEGQILVPRALWNAMGLTDRFHVEFQYRGSARSDNIVDFDDWSNKDGFDYYYVPDRLVKAQVDTLFPTSMRYLAAMYQLFWQRTHPKPPAPGSIQATDGLALNHIDVDWPDVAGETGYQLYRAATAVGPFVALAATSTNVTHYVDSVAPGTTNHYRVSAINLGGESACSPSDSGYTGILPATPPTISASYDTYPQKIVVSWGNVANEERYRLFRATSSSGPYDAITTTACNVTQVADPRPAGWVTAWYKVQAENQWGASPLSGSAIGRTGASTNNNPVWITASYETYTNKIVITWDNVLSEQSYDLYAQGAHGYSWIATTAANVVTYEDPMPIASGRSYYVIAHYTTGGWSQQSPIAWGRTGPYPPAAAPAGVAATDGVYTNAVMVTWSAVANATRYRIYRASASGGPYEFRSWDVGWAFHFYDMLPPGSPVFHYTVSAWNVTGESALSTADSGYTGFIPPPAPAWITASPGTSGTRITVAWAAVAGASGYTLYRQAPGGTTYAAIASTAAPAYVDESVIAGGVTSGARYLYKVVAYVEGHASGFSPTASGYTGIAPPATPATISAGNGTLAGRIQITWPDVVSEDGYVLESGPGAAGPFGTLVQTAAGETTHMHEPLDPNTTNYYRVKAFNSGGDSGWSAVDAGWTMPPPPDPPANVAASDGTFHERIRITWTTAPGVTAIRVYQGGTAHDAMKAVTDWIAPIALLDRLEGAVKPGALHFFRVRARNAAGDSELSAADAGWFGTPPETVATPVLTPGSHFGVASLDVAISCATPLAEIHFTTNGVDPTAADAVLPSSGRVAIHGAVTLKAKAWWRYEFESGVATGQYACVESPRDLIVAADVTRHVTLTSTHTGAALLAVETAAVIAKLDVADVDGDGQQEVLATPFAGTEAGALCLDPLLRTRWASAEQVGFTAEGDEYFGRKAWVADVDGDAEMEVVLPRWNARDGRFAYGVFSGRDGRLESVCPDAVDSHGVVYFDSTTHQYRLAASRNLGGRYGLAAYDLATWTRTWLQEEGDIRKPHVCARLAAAGDTPMAWGGGSGRVFMLDAVNGGIAWNWRTTATPEANAVFEEALRGSEDPVLLVEGSFGSKWVRLDCINLEPALQWTFVDSAACGFVHVMAIRDVDADGSKEIFVHTGGDGREKVAQYQCLDGATGARRWRTDFAGGEHLVSFARFTSAPNGSDLDVLVIVDDKVVAFDAASGGRTREWRFPGNVTTFELLTGFADSDGDGQADWAELAAGSDPGDPSNRFGFEQCGAAAGGFDFSWRSAAGRHYAVARSTNPSNGFGVVENNIPATPPVNHFTDHLYEHGARFYRVLTHE
jgi:fibronectin type 3 domain-containing protein